MKEWERQLLALTPLPQIYSGKQLVKTTLYSIFRLSFLKSFCRKLNSLVAAQPSNARSVRSSVNIQWGSVKSMDLVWFHSMKYIGPPWTSVIPSGTWWKSVRQASGDCRKWLSYLVIPWETVANNIFWCPPAAARVERRPLVATNKLSTGGHITLHNHEIVQLTACFKPPEVQFIEQGPFSNALKTSRSNLCTLLLTSSPRGYI